MSGELGEMNGTPCANALGRLHTGPIERSPAAYHSSSASSPRVDGLGAFEVKHRRRRPVVHRGAIEIAYGPGNPHLPGAFEREQPPGGGARRGSRHGVLDRWRELEFEHPIVAGDGNVSCATVRLGEHREDRPAHAAGAHPGEVQVTTGPAFCQQRVVVLGERIVVPVEHRRHGSYSGTRTGRSTAGRPSMLRALLSR